MFLFILFSLFYTLFAIIIVKFSVCFYVLNSKINRCTTYNFNLGMCKCIFDILVIFLSIVNHLHLLLPNLRSPLRLIHYLRLQGDFPRIQNWIMNYFNNNARETCTHFKQTQSTVIFQSTLLCILGSLLPQ